MIHLLERMLVFPAPSRRSGDWEPADLPYEDLVFTGEDGTRLHGWYMPHPAPRAFLLYSHGNGEHVARLAPRLLELRERVGVAAFAWDYRGYGKSQGRPTAELTIADARRAQLALAARAGIDPAEVVAVGHSLGGGVSVGLAARHEVRGLVLERTFARLQDAAAYHFPWLPVRWLMRNEFPSIEDIRRYYGPLLSSHGTQDEVVPYAMGRELFDACPSPWKEFFTIPEGRHNDPQPPEYDATLADWLDRLPSRGTRAERNGQSLQASEG
ncbi:MAG: alpha/beta fold hydrolase [Pirellulales bacterium]|nr:alpha/beta fold hydrolase [Pirellulales bacterium]